MAILGAVYGAGSAEQYCETQQTCDFFCFDRAFRAAGMVAILSVVRGMKRRGSKPDIVLFLPDSEIDFWERVAVDFNKNPMYPRMLIFCDRFTEGLSLSSQKYGFDTRKKLPRVAFGRLFATLELLRCGYERALYLDTDIVALSDVTSLFSVYQMGCPVSAIEERAIGLIQVAIRTHKILNGKYFNSGVMLFDLKHPSIETIVTEAIESIENPGVNLLFHDQCALNRAVGGNFHSLPGRYNFFVLPAMKANESSAESIILHFIDTPKPWDKKHHGFGGYLIWYQQWRSALDELNALGVSPEIIDGLVF